MGHVRAEMSCNDKNYYIKFLGEYFPNIVLDSWEAQSYMYVAVKDMLALG